MIKLLTILNEIEIDPLVVGARYNLYFKFIGGWSGSYKYLGKKGDIYEFDKYDFTEEQMRERFNNKWIKLSKIK